MVADGWLGLRRFCNTAFCLAWGSVRRFCNTAVCSGTKSTLRGGRTKPCTKQKACCSLLLPRLSASPPNELAVPQRRLAHLFRCEVQNQLGAVEPTPYLPFIALAHRNHCAGVLLDFPHFLRLRILVHTSEATRKTRQRCVGYHLSFNRRRCRGS